MSTQLWVIECPYCFKELIREKPPCPFCGVYWHDGDVKVYEAGPPGSHPPVEETYSLADLDTFREEAQYRRELAELDAISDRLWTALLRGGIRVEPVATK